METLSVRTPENIKVKAVAESMDGFTLLWKRERDTFIRTRGFAVQQDEKEVVECVIILDGQYRRDSKIVFLFEVVDNSGGRYHKRFDAQFR